jgi:PAS domain-containing protein
MQTRFISELCQLWDGQLEFSNQTYNHTLDGQRLEVRLRARILDGHEATWDRVLLTLEDVTQQEAATEALAEGERYARSLFELSPVSLWVEDFSAIKRLIDELRGMGIDDFATFVQVHPDFVTRCMQEIRVIDVNRHTLRMFAANDKQHLLRDIGLVFRDEMQASFQ